MSLSCASCHSALAADARFCPSCGKPVPASTPAPPADPVREILKVALGRQYEIQHLLGRGGMGAVYLATEAALEREVAVKVLPPDRGATKDSRDRFRREARTAARLSHPNIVPLYTFGDVDGTLYFVMGYVKGESLAARLKREGRLPVEEARRILIELCDALDYAHRLGVIHRDIKPDNVLIEEGTGRTLLTDFGVAKALGAGQTLTELGGVLGTPQYMSPEQAQGKADIDQRSDLYSLGVMGYAMLAGRLPFEGATPGDVMVQHITKEPPALSTLSPGVPAAIANALTRCLAKDRDQRWPDARALKTAVEAVDEGAIPEDMLEFRRDTFMVAAGLYFSALVGLHLIQRPVDPDPASFKPPWELVFFGTGAGILLWLYQMIQRRREGRSWSQIFGFAFTKPAWWVGWYPSRLRHRGDVWRRLPPDLRRARAAFWIFVLAWLAMMPAQFIIINSDDTYRRTGQKPPIQRLAAELPRGAVRTVVLSAAVGTLGLMTSLLLFVGRWGLAVRQSKAPRRLTNAMFFQDTGHRTFWSKPEVAGFLLPDRPDVAGAPATPRDLASAVSTAVTGLPDESRALGVSARNAAAALAGAISALDAEIASLAANADPAERERLEARVAALGPAPPEEDDARRQMGALLQKQLDLLRGFESRLEGLKAARARKLELLRALFLLAVDLRAATNDPARGNHATGRIRALCAEIAQHLDGAGTNPTAAITEAPTVERG